MPIIQSLAKILIFSSETAGTVFLNTFVPSVYFCFPFVNYHISEFFTNYTDVKR